MSEGNMSKKEIRSLGAHSDRKPETPVGLDGIHHISKAQGRKPLMSGRGLFDEPQEILPAAEVSNATELGVSEVQPRKLKFNAGTKLYRVKPDSEGNPLVPRTPVEENDLFDKQLTAATYFDVPAEFLEIGKKGGTITKIVGKSDYGAFTVVLCPIRQSNGEVILEERLVSYLTRSNKDKL